MNSKPVNLSVGRRFTVEVDVGGTPLGGRQPVRVQTMTTTSTNDTEATAAQCIRAARAGAEYVRITTQGVRQAANIQQISQRIQELGWHIPLVADVHFNPAAALEAAKYADKVRINPGNFVDARARFQQVDYDQGEYQAELQRIEDKLVPFIDICQKRGVAVRLGVNHGSLSDRIMSRFGDTPAGMVESVMEFLRIFVKHHFHRLVISMKSSNTRVMVQAVRLLVARMQAEDMHFPLHLGVTEAGDGDDGRIKSAVGIGALLADGIGDTIRVSLTEEPEAEIPVAQQLVKHFAPTFLVETSNQKSTAEQPSKPLLSTPDLLLQYVDNHQLPYNPFTYIRRKTRGVGLVGDGRPPVVVAWLSGNPSDAQLQLLGWRVNAHTGRFEPSAATAPDYFLSDNRAPFVSSLVERGLPLVSCVEVDHYLGYERADNQWVKATPEQLYNDALLLRLKADDSAVLLLCVDTNSPYVGLRAAFIHLMRQQVDVPVVVSLSYPELEDDVLDVAFNYQYANEFRINSSADLGGLLIDGLPDGILLRSSRLDVCQLTSISFAILQAARARITQTEYIACPGCGRTLYNLPQTLQRVRSATRHLRGLKIAVMGCIVNGPGEMADADYGYVGAAVGKISLYKGKTLIKRNIPESDAIDELVALIKANGDWNES